MDIITLRNISKNILLLITVSIICLFAINTGCKKDPVSNVPPDLEIIAQNLASPLSVIEAPDNSRRLFILDQIGKVWIIMPDGSQSSTPFIDISAKMVTLNPNYDERGLLGMAFHPNYRVNGKFYLFYTAPPRAGGPQPGVLWNNLTRISEFKVSSANVNLADIASERIIIEEDHPQGNHNGGTVAFGPDGYLYISIGDGGGRDDVGAGHVSDWYAANIGGNGQDIYANLMGSILRIDVNSGTNYSIPPDNPFVGTNAKKEIYAYGFRNPYRFSFDMGGAGQLYVGDAGQALYEEVSIVTKGGNYGWNVKEGTACFNTDNNLIERASCPSVDSAGKPLIDPIIQLKNFANKTGGAGIATVIVGGNVYRGSTLPQLNGKYIFGIFSQDGAANAKIFVGNPSLAGLWAFEEISFKSFPNNLGQYLKGFGQDLGGEIYLATSGAQGVAGTTGKIYRISAAK